LEHFFLSAQPIHTVWLPYGRTVTHAWSFSR